MDLPFHGCCCEHCLAIWPMLAHFPIHLPFWSCSYHGSSFGLLCKGYWHGTWGHMALTPCGSFDAKPSGSMAIQDQACIFWLDTNVTTPGIASTPGATILVLGHCLWQCLSRSWFLQNLACHCLGLSSCRLGLGLGSSTVGLGGLPGQCFKSFIFISFQGLLFLCCHWRSLLWLCWFGPWWDLALAVEQKHVLCWDTIWPSMPMHSVAAICWPELVL